MDLHTLIDDIFNAIVKGNMKDNRDAIPHSDTFSKEITTRTGIDDLMFENLIILLRDAHKIFVFEISKEDKDRNIDHVQGYVDADMTTIRRLKLVFQDLLVGLYEEEYGKKTMAGQAIAELFPRINTIANTPLGSVANKAIMLDEYERLLEKKFNDYTEDTKELLLEELVNERKDLFQKEIIKVNEEQKIKEEKKKASKKDPRSRNQRRAVDTDKAVSFDDNRKDLPVEKLISIYGIDFFLRVHLRRYEFDLVKNTVEQGHLRRPDELKKLKTYLTKLKQNASNDPGIDAHMSELYSLDRVVSYFLHRVAR